MTKLRRFIIIMMVSALALTICMYPVYAADEDDTDNSAVALDDGEDAGEDAEEDDGLNFRSPTAGGGFYGSLFSRDDADGLFNLVFMSTIGQFIADIVNDLIELLDTIAMRNLMAGLRVEQYFTDVDGSNVLRASTLQGVYAFVYQIAVILVTIKFLFKGFQIYVLWRNGDADASPRDMIIGVISAEIAMICFPFVYDAVVDIINFFVTNVLALLGGETAMPLSANVAEFVNRIANSLVMLICMLIWGVMGFILYVKILMQGLELMILRLGLPLATVGLVDSDMQLFKNYILVFIKTFFTLIVQITMMSLSMRIIITSVGASNLTLFLGIGMMSVALSTPKLLSQFMMPQGSQGMLQKTSSAAMLARSVKALFV